MICLAQSLGSALAGAVLASIPTSLFLAARQGFQRQEQAARLTPQAPAQFRSFDRDAGSHFSIATQASLASPRFEAVQNRRTPLTFRLTAI
jgi:hypothetical protein